MSSASGFFDKISESSEPKFTESTKRKITIKLEAYKHIETIFPICDIQTECFFNHLQIGETNVIPITDNELLPLEHTFVLEIDTSKPEELDTLISTPAIFKVYITPGAFDVELYEQLKVNPHFAKTKTKSFDSVVSIYEALTDNKLDELSPARRKSMGKKEKTKGYGKKEKSSDVKLKRQSLSSSSTINSDVETLKEKEPRVYEPVTSLYGECILDFIPLFHGEKNYTEALLMTQPLEFQDDRMRTYKTHPQLIISLEIDEPLLIKHSMIMYFSVESIFNYPNTDVLLDAKICWVLPKSEDSYCEPIVFANLLQTEYKIEGTYKLWPNNYRGECYPTKYVRNIEFDDIKCKIDEDIYRYFGENVFRLECNVIKRNFFQPEGRKTIEEVIKVTQKILLEIYVCPAKSTKKSMTKLNFDSNVVTHLMAIVDVSGLLYPGARKTRVATQLCPFSLDEARNVCGVEQSYFRPNLGKEEKNEEQKRTKHEKEKKIAPKSVRSSKKSSLGTENTANKTLLLEETESGSSRPIFNELGRPCFIVIEIELSESIIKMREIEDLSTNLKELIQNKPESEDKIVLNHVVARDYYVEVLNEIIGDINQKFLRFLEENPKLKDKTSTCHDEFLKFLQDIGAYKLYLNSITRAISIVATTETRFKGYDDSDPESTSNFIGEIFCFLVSKMHDTVNGLICNGLQVSKHRKVDYSALFVYAKEAAEFGMIETANRYFLERVSNDENNADYWFDYAIFFLEQSDHQRALECIRNALNKNSKHKYSLLLFAMLLDDKNQKEEAETAFLNLMVLESSWVEGWGVLYLFYRNMENYVSMDWAVEMAKKNLNHVPASDYFSDFEDLAWLSRRYPNRVFLRTTIILIKLRMLDWAEMACSQERHAYSVYYSELLAVICYYRKMFSRALQHIEDSRTDKMLDRSIIALSGHCLLGMSKKEQAKSEYYYLLTSENIPEHLHLVYMNCAKIMEDLGDSQEARKLVLLACKYHPTPYTWFKAGHFYYQQMDFLSAEECLSHANSLDTRNALIWGYLTLINLKLMRFNEASLCYDHAVKNNLKDEDLLNVIQEERRKHGLEDSNSLS